MVLTPSTMLPLGTPLPTFALEAVQGGRFSTRQLEARPVLVLVLCAHCPFVIHIEPALSRLQHDFSQQVQIVALSSNSTTTHPQDGPEGLRDQARRNGWQFPYLWDADQSVAHALHAACTPDLYLFDASHHLVYRGQLDGSRPGNTVPLDGRDLRSAIQALLAGEAINPEQRPSIGCNIKWHPNQQA
jgi:peroxiredoxin